MGEYLVTVWLWCIAPFNLGALLRWLGGEHVTLLSVDPIERVGAVVGIILECCLVAGLFFHRPSAWWLARLFFWLSPFSVILRLYVLWHRNSDSVGFVLLAVGLGSIACSYVSSRYLKRHAASWGRPTAAT